MNDKSFSIKLETRDYECDLQGIINNAVYFNYFEHTRHKFLHEIGLDFANLHKRGIDAVLRRSEIDYIASLRGGESVASNLRIESKGILQLTFVQELLRDGAVMAKSVNNVVFVAEGKPIRRPPEVESALQQWWNK